jgi:polyisoprenoid-binding protein YceI
VDRNRRGQREAATKEAGVVDITRQWSIYTKRDVPGRWSLVIVVVAALATQLVDVRAANQTYRIDPAKSRATIHVGKAGMFSFVAGHTHEVSGPIESGAIDVDLEAPSRARIRLVIAARDLIVSPAGEPRGDAPKVQEAMDGPAVLDVAHHRDIIYESTSVAVKSTKSNSLDIVATGQLTIRDVTQPISAPVHVEIADRDLAATGHFTIKQSAFGITPISVGGVVAVKDTLEIAFSIVATRYSAERPAEAGRYISGKLRTSINAM